MLLPMTTELENVMGRVRTLTEQYRAQCLWFMRADYIPGNVADACQVLDYIQRHGDLKAFRRAGELRTWLLRNSSAASAA
jgi:hypothetical protein